MTTGYSDFIGIPITTLKHRKDDNSSHFTKEAAQQPERALVFFPTHSMTLP
jgi:hypothetical protein